jgi:hypothetical protein
VALVFDVFGGALIERHHPGTLQPGLVALGVLGVDGVDAIQ